MQMQINGLMKSIEKQGKGNNGNEEGVKESSAVWLNGDVREWADDFVRGFLY